MTTVVVKPKELPQLGELELETLRFVSEHAPISVGEVAKELGSRRSLARTTLLTVMERLRAKGYLARRRVGGIYQYSPKVGQREVLSTLVAEFVERSLGGSLTPFVSYLADSGRLAPDELEQLQQLIDSFETQGPQK